MKIKPFRVDGGDIGTGRIREIADNPYGDEEKCWLAKRVLALLDELEESERLRLKFQGANCELCQKLEGAEKRIADYQELISSLVGVSSSILREVERINKAAAAGKEKGEHE